MKKNNKNSGQALVALLMFVLMAISAATAAGFVIANNSVAAGDAETGIMVRQMADSGVETAYLGFLRQNDNYTGETLSLNGGTVEISISGAGEVKTITSRATLGNFVKTVESVVSYSNNVLSKISWKEVN
jgi:hypothetical protein